MVLNISLGPLSSSLRMAIRLKQLVHEAADRSPALMRKHDVWTARIVLPVWQRALRILFPEGFGTLPFAT